MLRKGLMLALPFAFVCFAFYWLLQAIIEMAQWAVRREIDPLYDGAKECAREARDAADDAERAARVAAAAVPGPDTARPSPA